MSTLTVTNITTPDSNTPLSLTTGNTTAADIIVNNDSVNLQISSTVNATINTTALAINGVVKISVPDTLPSFSGTLVMSGNVTPTKIAANTSAWNPDSTDIASFIRAEANSTTSEFFISGFSAGSNGQIYTIQNIGATKINFKKEDSVNETTAANRFNFPNDVVLGGYMSMELYYDGTLARWRMVDSVGIPFDHKYSLTKGFFSGGSNPATVATADRTTYSTETTAAVAGANLSQARSSPGASGNSVKGFFSGGATPAYVATADRTNYSSETTAAVTGANLSQTRGNLYASGNADKGFFSGGFVTPSTVATTDRTTYSTETTAAVSGANLSSARSSPSSAGNADKGFFSGGATPTAVATSDRTTYSTETTAAVSGANLSSTRFGSAAAGNSDKGFFSGGSTGTVVATADRTTYSSETTAAVAGANLSQVRVYLGAAGSDIKGFFSGGTVTPIVATADRTTYSTEATAAVAGANLTQAKQNIAAV